LPDFFLNLDRALKERRGAAADQDALSEVFEEKLAAARGNLDGMQDVFLQSLGPKGDEKRVRRAGDRVLGNSGPRGEETGHKIVALTLGRDDDT